GRDVVLGQQIADVRGQVRPVELRRRQVDGHREIAVPVFPETAQVGARRREHVGADLVDLAGFFRQWDEYAGRNLAEVAVVPTQQRLHAGDGFAVQVHLGLINQP